MKPVFLDTCGLIAALNTRDQWHVQAKAVWSTLIASNAPLLTTSLVLIELGDGLARIDQRQFALDLRAKLLESPIVEIVTVTTTLEQRGWDLYGNRADKGWGITDCVSFVLSNDRGIEEAFTADRHFEQAGFKLLLSQ